MRPILPYGKRVNWWACDMVSLRSVLFFVSLHLPLLGWSLELFPRDQASAAASLPHWSNPVLIGHGGITLPVKVTSEDRRVFFDYAGNWDLSRSSCFRFELHAHRPDLIKEGLIYFRSGKGWKWGSFEMRKSGANIYIFPKDRLNTEGAFDSWGKVDRIRLAFWPRRVGTAALSSIRLSALRPGLAVLDSSPQLASDPNHGYLSRNVTKRIEGMLAERGIPFQVITSDRMAANPPRVVILPYNPKLRSTTLRTLQGYKRRGTKFIVFQSDNSALLSWFDLRPGNAISSKSFGNLNHWVSSEMAKKAGFPMEIHQHAWWIRDVTPVNNTPRIFARWAHADGSLVGANAVVEHPNGFWLTHVFRAADRDRKIRLLLLMISHLDAASGRWACEALLARNSYQNRFAYPAGKKPTNPRATQLLERARTLRQHAQATMQDGNSYRALRMLTDEQRILDRVWVLSQPKLKAPLRGIWDQNGTGLYAGSWEQTSEELKKVGFTAVFPNMCSAGRAHYPSKFLPGSKTLERHGDQLAAFTRAAGKHGLERHIWKICWKMNSADPAFTKKMSKAGRLMQDANGNDLPWLSPSHPANVQHEINCLLEIAKKYDIEGLHLDYMRYPGHEADYGPAARAAFERQLGRKVTRWPQDVVSGSLQTRYRQFKVQTIHNAMQKIHAAVKRQYPTITLSAAVWGYYPGCVASKSQDWPVWTKNGWVDWIIPMNYTMNKFQLHEWLTQHRALPGVRDKLLCGVGLIATGAELSPVELRQQLGVCESLSPKGHVLYRLDTSQVKTLFPLLRAAYGK